MDDACGEYVTVPATGKQPPSPAYERAVTLAGRIVGWCFRFAVLNGVAYALAHAVPRARDERHELAFFAGAYIVLAAWLRRGAAHDPGESPSSWDWWRRAARVAVEALGDVLCFAFAYRVAALAGSPALAVLVWFVSVAVLFAGLYVAVYCFRKDQQQYQALGDVDGDNAGGGGSEGKAVEKIASADEMLNSQKGCFKWLWAEAVTERDAEAERYWRLAILEEKQKQNP
ncbi:hypothetical protein EJB05_33180, partial [Eragrostis curvula]